MSRKQGLLYGDSAMRDLSADVETIFTKLMMDGASYEDLKEIGITYSEDYLDGGTLVFDESKFRDAMESDYDGVVDIFTRTKDNGAESDGLMQGIKTQMDRYGSTTGVVKGILVQQAGTPLASLTLLDNGWQKEIDNYSDQISKWQDKLESQVDRYTKMFTRLEMLTNQMNSQSSALASLMGGG